MSTVPSYGAVSWNATRRWLHEEETPMSHPSIETCIRTNLATYFADLGDTEPGALYDMVVKAVERPLLDEVMQRAGHNQSRAAQWLGLNRNTLRKKLLEHGLIE